jgi:alkanesulfonate monooxygenase SsuD/methylene tetrahydromethanopterin reductase-like flavin-dependent oxidoreductase (luciferase family)
MKSYLFHLMPYPELPPDFDSYEAASVTYPNKHFDPKVGHQLYNRYLDELEYAEELGFEGVCVNEHHQTTYGIMPGPNLIAASLARRTERMKIAIVGNGIPLRDHPLRVAEEVAMIDCISGGRVISGFVRGIGMEYFGMGLDPTRSRDRFLEAHDLIIKAWTEPGPFEWVSHNYEFRYVNPWPRVYQQPHPPIWIPAFGSTETMHWVAEKRYTYLSVYAPTRLIKRWFDQVREATLANGYEAPPEMIGLLLPIYVADTDEIARKEATQYLYWLFHKGLKVKFQHQFPPGYLTAGSMRGLLSAGMKAFGDLDFDDMIEAGHAIVGSPDTVREKLAEMQDHLGFGTLCALLQFGDMPHDKTVHNMELFAREVMPAFNDRQPVPAEVPAPAV